LQLALAQYHHWQWAYTVNTAICAPAPATIELHARIVTVSHFLALYLALFSRHQHTFNNTQDNAVRCLALRCVALRVA